MSLSLNATQEVLTRGTGKSRIVTRCQSCGSPELKTVVFLGYLPPVNHMRPTGSRPVEEEAFPAELLACCHCHLVQLGLIVDPQILFPPEYPYTSGTTKILRDNFAELYREAKDLLGLKGTEKVVDIGSNDGTLLSNFKNAGHPVFGIEPTLMARLAAERGIPSLMAFFDKESAAKARADFGRADLLTATNVFAHIEDIHGILGAVGDLLNDRGVFVTESHYWGSLVDTLQYDTIYHEHLRYYSLTSLKVLLESQGFEVFHARKIPTHGGSIRVYAARKGERPARESVAAMLAEEKSKGYLDRELTNFRERMIRQRSGLRRLISDIRDEGKTIYGVGAPSRASTLVHYAGLDDGDIECVLEVKGSYKTAKNMPGTLIPVVEEERMLSNPPDYLLLFSWHIADELIPKLKAKGFKGGFIVPLPEPRIFL